MVSVPGLCGELHAWTSAEYSVLWLRADVNTGACTSLGTGVCLTAACMIYSNVRLLLTARRCGRWIEGTNPCATDLSRGIECTHYCGDVVDRPQQSKTACASWSYERGEWNSCQPTALASCYLPRRLGSKSFYSSY